MKNPLTHRSYSPAVRATAAAQAREAANPQREAATLARKVVTPTPRPHVPASAVNAALRGIASGTQR